MPNIQRFALFGLAASVFFPKGIQWFFMLILLVSSLVLAVRVLNFNSGRYVLSRHPLGMTVLIWISWLVVSAFWSDVSDREFWVNFGHYSLIALVPILGVTLRTVDAKLALGLLAASAIIWSAVILLSPWIPVPNSGALKSLLRPEGNKTIANAIFLVCAAGVLLHWALAQFADYGFRSRLAWGTLVTCGFVSTAILLRVESRTALFLLPLIFMIVTTFSPIRLGAKVIALIVCLSLVTVGAFTSDTASRRIALAVKGLSAPTSIEGHNNSVVIRRLMNKHSLQMIEERPITGYGLGGWVAQWDARVPEHKVHRSQTAHNEYLNIPAQLGLIGGLFFMAILGSMLVVALEGVHRERGLALLFSATWIFASAFNATLRDAVFALPLIVLAGVGFAASRTLSEQLSEVQLRQPIARRRAINGLT